MLIGITGRAGCGKNTLADAIAATRPAAIVAFADALRDVVEAAFGSRYETQEAKAAIDDWWASRLKNYHQNAPEMLYDEPVTGRRILQFVGTELFRQHVHPDFWLFAMERRLLSVREHLVVVPDVRFDNEARFIRSRGGVVIHLRRLDQIAPAEGHTSEAGVSTDLIDFIENTSAREHTQILGVLYARRYGQAVVFAEGGRLLDGHHRLEAVKASGCTVAMLVVYGVPASAWGKLDCGVVRAVHDRLQLLDVVKDNRRAVEILQNLRRIEHSHTGKLTPETIRQDWSELRPHVLAVLTAFPQSIKGLTRVPMLCALVRYHQLQATKSLELSRQLLTGADLASDSPALLLRNWLMIDTFGTHGGGSTAAKEIYWRTVAACKAHRDGQRFTTLVRASSWGMEAPAAVAGEVA